MIIVLVTSGKLDSVMYAKVVLFESANAAKMFCEFNNTGRIKHWTQAVIVDSNEKIELLQPEE